MCSANFPPQGRPEEGDREGEVTSGQGEGPVPQEGQIQERQARPGIGPLSSKVFLPEDTLVLPEGP